MKKYLPTIKKYFKYLLIGVLIYLFVRYIFPMLLMLIAGVILGIMFGISSLKPIPIDSMTIGNYEIIMEYQGDCGATCSFADSRVYKKEIGTRKEKTLHTFTEMSMVGNKLVPIDNEHVGVYANFFDEEVCKDKKLTDKTICPDPIQIINLNQ